MGKLEERIRVCLHPDMSRRFELRIDEDEYRAIQSRARAVGVPNVSEYLRRLAREDARRSDDRMIVDLVSRASEPKVR